MDNDNRDGRAAGHDGDGAPAKQPDERRDRKRDAKRSQGREELDDGKPAKFHLSRKTLIIGGIILGLVLMGVFIYWLHARLILPSSAGRITSATATSRASSAATSTSMAPSHPASWAAREILAARISRSCRSRPSRDFNFSSQQRESTGSPVPIRRFVGRQKWVERVDAVKLQSLTPALIEKWKLGFLNQAASNPARHFVIKSAFAGSGSIPQMTIEYCASR